MAEAKSKLLLNRDFGPFGILGDLREVIGYHPNEITKKYGLSLINILLEEYDEAIKNLNFIIKKNPGHYLVERRLGEIFIRRAEYENAIFHLEKAIELYPQDLTSIMLLALTYSKMGENEKAALKLNSLEEYIAFLNINWICP